MISVVIPAYKNKSILLANLRQNLPFFKGCEIIVVNDDPSESLQELLQEFEAVQLLENEENMGFGQTVNKGIAHAKGNYILLLNTDVVLHDAGFKKALKHFANTKVFAVSFAQKENDGRIVGKNIIRWKNGFLMHDKAQDILPGYTGWAEGGSCLIKKDIFHKIGGFEKLYSPFYWEDIDLSYRAWKRGYIVLFDPDIVVDHPHGSTIGKYFESAHVQNISYRNQCIFTWLNLTSLKLLMSNKFHLILLMGRAIVRMDTNLLAGFSWAFVLLPQVLWKKRSFWKNQVRRDQDILNMFA